MMADRELILSFYFYLLHCFYPSVLLLHRLSTLSAAATRNFDVTVGHKVLKVEKWVGTKVLRNQP